MSAEYPSEPVWWAEFEREVAARYASRNRALDLQAFRWWSRTGFDIGDGLTADQSKAKHLIELDQELGPVPGQPPPSGAVPGRLRRQGRSLVHDAGRYHWRMVTAFRLVQMASRGEPIEPFLDWCRVNRVGVRVLVMCKNMFELDPVDGRAALPIVLQAAADRGVYVEVVCLADTFAYALDAPSHVEEIGWICARFVNTVLEGANEALQKWQRFTPEALLAMCRRVPSEVAWTLSGPDGEADESTDFITELSAYGVSHTSRVGGPWRKVRHIREQQVIADRLNLYMVDDEPENAKEMTDAQLFAAGALAGVCQIGQTHHADWGKTCALLTDEDQRRFDARRRGWESVPADFWGTFANYGWTAPNPESPVDRVTFLSDDGRAYSSITANEAYAVLIHANSPTFKADWHGDRIAGDDEASVWRCTR